MSRWLLPAVMSQVLEQDFSPVNGNTFTWKGLSYTVIVKDYGGGVVLAWLDRNLGASRVATSATDTQGYGDLYQWGRLEDGHQISTSGTTSTESSTDVPGHGNFITGSSDWRDPKNDSLWQGTEGINNPSPPGWRLPTVSEMESEFDSWSSADVDGGYASNLKFPAAGRRMTTGVLDNVGARGYIWTSTINVDNSESIRVLSNGVAANTGARAVGMTVRCVRNV